MSSDDTILGINSGKRIEVVIDGNHFHSMARMLDFDVDYDKFRRLLHKVYDPLRFDFFIRAVYTDDGEIRDGVIARLLDFLRFNGYRLTIVETKEATYGDGRRTTRVNAEVPMACCMLSAVIQRDINEIVLVAGTDELIPAIITAQEMGARVTLVSVQTAITNVLRRAADNFVDLAMLKSQIFRERDRQQVTGEADIIDDRRTNPTDRIRMGR